MWLHVHIQNEQAPGIYEGGQLLLWPPMHFQRQTTVSPGQGFLMTRGQSGTNISLQRMRQMREGRTGALRARVAETRKPTKTLAGILTNFVPGLFPFPPAVSCTDIILIVELGALRLRREAFLPKAEFGGLGLELRPSDSKAHTLSARAVVLP